MRGDFTNNEVQQMLDQSHFFDRWIEDRGAGFMRRCRGDRSIRQFSKDLGINATYMSRIENGKVKVGRPTLGKLLEEALKREEGQWQG